MSDGTVQEILKRIDLVAVKLNVTAAHLWAVLIAQARVEAIKDVILCAICLAVAAVYVVRFKTLWRLNSEAAYFEDRWSVLLIVGGALALVCAFAALLISMELVTLIYNPEYWALTELLRGIR